MPVLVLYTHRVDRIGRKPVLVLSLVALDIDVVLCGPATTLLQTLLIRCLVGLVLGGMVIIRVMLSEP